jgi:uncharacterized protein with ParB-like and HNH nuclease domain/predicted transport protein
MKANAIKVLSFLKKGGQFIVPIYQRNYSWDEKQCDQLWNDVLEVGRNGNKSAHFMGSIVYVEDGLGSISMLTPHLVIDGQQRLTTLTIFLEALSRHIGDSEPVEGFSAKKIRNNYLSNPDEIGEKNYKLVLAEADKETLFSLVSNRPYPANSSEKIIENFEFFASKLAKNSKNIIDICNGLAKLVIVDISLDRNLDEPQEIFESMNSTGKELSQADLVRNYALMSLEPKLQTELYFKYWRPMEIDFGQSAYDQEFDSFMRNFLTIKMNEIPRISEVFEAFKSHTENVKADAEGSIESVLIEVHRFSKYYVSMINATGVDPKLVPILQRLFGEFKYTVSVPFLLNVFDDYHNQDLDLSDFLQVLNLVESYVVRRAICDIPTNSMNKTFAEFHKYIDKSRYLESVKAHFASLQSYRRFPDETEFVDCLGSKDIYHTNMKENLLLTLENFGKKERVLKGQYTVEHILPQNPNLSENWISDLGPDWQAVQARYAHTLGNLTLTGYNSEYSDKPFIEKRDMKNGFASSPISLNENLRNATVWNEQTIQERAKALAIKALQIWPNLDFDLSRLKEFSSKENTEENEAFDLDDHEFLQREKVRIVFDSLKTEILRLGNDVTMNVRKHWISFRVDSPFVDVIPKALGLRLTVNLKMDEVEDPQSMAVDISGKGRWGTGDVSINLRSVEDIPYVMKIIELSYSKQESDLKTIPK